MILSLILILVLLPINRKHNATEFTFRSLHQFAYYVKYARGQQRAQHKQKYKPTTATKWKREGEIEKSILRLFRFFFLLISLCICACVLFIVFHSIPSLHTSKPKCQWNCVSIHVFPIRTAAPLINGDRSRVSLCQLLVIWKMKSEREKKEKKTIACTIVIGNDKQLMQLTNSWFIYNSSTSIPPINIRISNEWLGIKNSMFTMITYVCVSNIVEITDRTSWAIALSNAGKRSLRITI